MYVLPLMESALGLTSCWSAPQQPSINGQVRHVCLTGWYYNSQSSRLHRTADGCPSLQSTIQHHGSRKEAYRSSRLASLCLATPRCSQELWGSSYTPKALLGEVKSTDCACRGPRFGPQHPPSVTVGPVLSSCPYEP